VRACGEIESFVRSPVGRYYRGRSYLAWCHGPRLVGTVHWGRTENAELDELVRLLDFAFAPSLAPPYDVVIDAIRVDAIPEPSGYQLMADFVQQRIGEFDRRFRRHAVVHPKGMPGSLIAGFLPVFAPGHCWRLFDDPGAAFDWLDNPEAEVARRRVEELVAAAVALGPTTAALRHLLDSRNAPSTLPAAARALGASSRSLQRILHAEGTSFREELIRTRVRIATPLVLESRVKLEAVARQVGCSSLPVFSRLFRRITGESPSQARARHRAMPR
jgi:AraC-like DNA-binding protein